MGDKKNFYLKVLVAIVAVIIFIIWLFFLADNFSKIDAKDKDQKSSLLKEEISEIIGEGKEVLNPIK